MLNRRKFIVLGLSLVANVKASEAHADGILEKKDKEQKKLFFSAVERDYKSEPESHTFWVMRDGKAYNITNKMDAKINLRRDVDFFYVIRKSSEIDAGRGALAIKTTSQVRSFDKGNYDSALWIGGAAKSDSSENDENLNRALNERQVNVLDYQTYHSDIRSEMTVFQKFHKFFGKDSQNYLRTDGEEYRQLFLFEDGAASSRKLIKKTHLYSFDYQKAEGVIRHNYINKDIVSMGFEIIEFIDDGSLFQMQANIINIDK